MEYDTMAARLTGAGVILAGGLTVVVGCLWLALLERRRAASLPGETNAADLTKYGDRRWLAALGVLVLIGLALRLIGLDARGISHVEAYIPGINLPAGISEPPPRHGLLETIRWHFYFEPHPIGYYLGMWAWTKVFGASLVSTRIPEAILGAMSIPLIYRVGALAYDKRVGLAAAALLSIHGFHIFWSQLARMYVPGAFLGLVSTWLLLEITRRKRPNLGLEAGYVAANLAGVLTVELFWPFLCGQMLWTALQHRGGTSRIPRVAGLQALAFILGAPLLSQAVMTAVGGFGTPPSLSFLAEYVAYGFAYLRSPFTLTDLPALPWVLIVASGLALIAVGLATSPKQGASVDETPSLAPLPLTICALGAAAIMAGISLIAYARNGRLLVMSLVPLAALAIPWGVAWFRPLLARVVPAVERRLDPTGRCSGLIALQAVVPPLVVFLVSFKIELTVQRAFLVFIPYLLILIAAGAIALGRNRAAGVGVAATLAVIFTGSVAVASGGLNTPRDYRGLAQAMQAKMRPDDLVFVRIRNWTTTPIFVHLRHEQLVASDYGRALQRSPKARVWVLWFGEDAPATPEMLAPLSRYRRIDQARSVLREVAQADLYAPPE